MTRIEYRGCIYTQGNHLADNLLADEPCSRLEKLRDTEDAVNTVRQITRLAEWFDALDALIEDGYTSWNRVKDHHPEIYRTREEFERHLRSLLNNEHEEVVACALLAIRDQATLLRLLLQAWEFNPALIVPLLSHVVDPTVERELYDRSLNPEVREHIWEHTENPELLMQIALGSDASLTEIAYERLQAMALSRCARADELYQKDNRTLRDCKAAWNAVACAMRLAHIKDRTPEIESMKDYFRGDEFFECMMQGWFKFTPGYAGIISLSKEQLLEVAWRGASPEGRWAAVEWLDHDSYVKLVNKAEDLSMLHTSSLGFHYTFGKLEAPRDSATILKIVTNETTRPAFREEILTNLRDSDALAALVSMRGVEALHIENIGRLPEELKQEVYLRHSSEKMRNRAASCIGDQAFREAHGLPDTTAVEVARHDYEPTYDYDDGYDANGYPYMDEFEYLSR